MPKLESAGTTGVEQDMGGLLRQGTWCCICGSRLSQHKAQSRLHLYGLTLGMEFLRILWGRSGAVMGAESRLLGVDLNSLFVRHKQYMRRRGQPNTGPDGKLHLPAQAASSIQGLPMLAQRGTSSEKILNSNHVAHVSRSVCSS